MKRLIAICLTLTLALACLPMSSLAAAKKMNDGVPVWTEETVKQYAEDFIGGNDFERLFGYYDLQIRRYMPMDTYTGMLTEIEWMTGAFIEFGTYSSFEETQQKTKTHVLHLCMEKQDLDLYFTHKNQEDDWEIMAVEFVPAEKQDTSDHREMLVTDGDETTEASSSVAAAARYTEVAVKVGSEPYLLDGILTLPDGASATSKVPAVVLVHGSGPSDMDETLGQTKLFADLASYFASRGIATLRYNKRTYTYGKEMSAEEIANITVEEETIQDAISAGQVLAANECVDSSCLVLLGHSMGAMLAPRIASEANKLFTAMILVAGSPNSLLDVMLTQNENILATLEGDARTQAEEQVNLFAAQVAALKKVKNADDAKAMTIVGVNGYYFWEMMQYDACKLIEKLKLPTYIVQGNEDFQISVDDGVNAYEDAISEASKFVEFKVFRKLNHVLMKYEGEAEYKGTVAEYNTPATLDKQAGRYLADWILDLVTPSKEE